MSLIPQNFIDELLDRTDIVEVIDSRVKLKKAGKNYLACCPFHKEKTPSFSVSPDKQFYYCFGCGASGTALTFLLEYEHLGFIDAVESLARNAGVQVPKEASKQPQKSHKTLYSLLEKAAAYYQEQLKTHSAKKVAVSYLQQRGLTGEVCKQFGVGYAPPGWDNLQTKLGVTEQDRALLLEGGMLIQKEQQQSTYDRFRNRIMFPILDVRGRTIGFGGRVLASDEKGPKYLNSPETPVFHKGRELYGLYQARQQAGQIANLLVVEGYMDVIALAQFDITNAVATLGTACGEDHLKLAFRYTSEVVFCFDGDNAGRKAARRALENALPAMTDGRQVKFLFLPEGQDPDSLVRQVGAERFLETANNAVPLEEFFFEAVSEGIDVRTMEGRARMSKHAAPLLHRLPQGVYRQLMFEYLARRTGLSMDVLKELVELPEQTQAKPGVDQAVTLRQEQSKPPASNGAFANKAFVNKELPQQYSASAQVSSSEPWLAVEAHAAVVDVPAGLRTKARLSPARIATALLLEQPVLIEQVADIELPELNEPDAACLKQLAEYLKPRPQASFHTILGYWGGRYGLEAQKQLAQLVANQFLGSAGRSATFNAVQELKDAYSRIVQHHTLQAHEQELKALSDLAELNDEQKQRLRELLTLKSQVRSPVY